MAAVQLIIIKKFLRKPACRHRQVATKVQPGNESWQKNNPDKYFNNEAKNKFDFCMIN